jgi:hypothetical protein
MEKKFILELTENQANAIVLGLEAFMRLGIAQYSNAIELALPAHRMMGYNQIVEDACNLIKREILDISCNGSLSICNKKEVSESVKIAHDIYEVMRNKISWDKYPQGGSGVNFSQPLQTSKEKLPIFKIEK